MRKLGLIAAAAVLLSGPVAAQIGPSDAEIAHIAYTAGSLDVAAARQALQISRNEAVRSFAETMIRDHEAVNQKALALVKELNVTPAANPVSSGLTQEAEATARRLSALRGAAFDRAYAENEAAFHKTVNGALQTTLIPSADNPQLKSLLETGLALFREHQAHAEQLAAGLK